MGRRGIKKTKLRWGETRIKTQPLSNQPEHIFRFACDTVCQEIQEELRQTAEVYTSDKYTQEELLRYVRTGIKPERR